MGRMASRLGPLISIRIEREPPTDRPNSDAWRTKAPVPGSEKIGRLSTSCSSDTRDGSFAEAPAKAPPEKATKKKRSMAGGPPSSGSVSQSGRAADSIFSAMRSVSSRE